MLFNKTLYLKIQYLKTVFSFGLISTFCAMTNASENNRELGTLNEKGEQLNESVINKGYLSGTGDF
ncbi:hypothetical protein [Pleionea sediminis]|uniref:hypothetical protein n=1 Tax=Pleionea sediminis TaxID=2569479 RepID=UPI001186F665|nr:hypothetical protein [Pleionea sediminis]